MGFVRSLSQKISDDVARIYQKRKNEAHRERDYRVRALYAGHPRLEALDNELTRAGFDRLLQVTSPEEASNEGQSFDDISVMRERYLAEYGILDGYHEPIYHCRSCGDTGRIGDAWCPCRRQIVQSILPDYLPDRMSGEARFSNFNLNVFQDGKAGQKGPNTRDVMADYLHMAQLYTGHFDRVRDRNLLFSGPPGTGKTFLMQCMGHRLMDEDRPVIYITAPNLFDLITRYKRQLASFRPDPTILEEAEMLYHALHSWDLLLLDDLGTEPVTQDRYAQLIMLLDTRQNRNLATIVASNLSVRDFAKQYDTRVASRLKGNFLVYRFPGEDLRGQQAGG